MLPGRMLALLALACSRTPEPYPLEFLERSPDASATLPMIVAIHGNSGRPERMLAMAEACGLRARLIVPRGPRPEANGSFSWFDIRLPTRPSWDVKMAVAQTDRVALLLKRLVQDRPTAGRPIVTGFSGGGVIAYALVARHPDLVSAAVPVSGTFAEGIWPEDRPAADPEPVIRAVQPELDPLVPPRLAEGVAKRFAEKGIDIELKVIPGLSHEFGEDLRPHWCEALGSVLR